MLLDGRRSSCPRRGDKGQCWLQVYARLSKPAVNMMSHTCVGAAVSALAFVGRAYLIPRASSHRVRTRRHRRGQRSCPAARRFDRHVFFALGCLVWVRWWAPWPRSSKIPTLLSGQRATAGLSASICGLFGARSTRASTSTHEPLRTTAAASICRLHTPLVSC